MRILLFTLWWVAVVRAEESTTAAVVPKETGGKDQAAAASDLDDDYLDLGSVSSGLLSPGSWKPISGPYKQHIPDSGAEADIETITLTKRVPVPYPVTVEKRVPVKVEVPVDKPYPVYVPRPYHVVVEKKVPYHIGVPVPQPYTVEKHVPVPVRVPVDKPIPVVVPHPYPVLMYRKVPYTVERHVPYPVRVPYIRPYPVHVPVEKQIPFPVEKPVPYPVHVAVERPVPVPVEKPVPYPVEKIVPYHVEKIVRVPYKVPVKVHVQVPVPLPVTSHQHSQDASVHNELYSATDNSQLHQQLYRIEENTNDPSEKGRGENSEVYGKSGQKQIEGYRQLPYAQHQIEGSTSQNGHVRFPQENLASVAEVGATNMILQDQENSYHQVGSHIKVEPEEISNEYQSQNTIVVEHGLSRSPTVWNPHSGHTTQQSGNEPFGLRQLDQVRAHTRGQSSQNDLAEFEKRLKDGRQESYSKVNMGPTAFTNSVHHGQTK